MFTVHEAALITGLTEHAVRYYTDKGLIPSVQRNKIMSGYLMMKPSTGSAGSDAKSKRGYRLKTSKPM